MALKKGSKIYLGTDHAGFRLKEAGRAYLERLGYETVDMGAYDEKPSDYPDLVIAATKKAVRNRARAIVFGGSGIGEAIAANKVKGARAALVYDTYTARMSRKHNDANVLALGGRTVTKDPKLAKRLIKIWLETPFSKAARHARRIGKIAKYEK